jgi:predicted ATPase
MTDVELNNLSLDSTKEILMDMLSLQDNTSSTKQMLMNMLSSRKEDVTKLSELCYEYSHGNTYFLKRFLEVLHKKKLLYMDSRSGKWSWDLCNVTSVLTSSNVTEVILGESANKLPKQAKSLLLLATCMGSTYIDEDLLFLAWSKFERKSRSSTDFQSQFCLFINESLYRKVLVKVEHPLAKDKRAYHWAHESMIQELIGGKEGGDDVCI